ncbi:MAG: hypothetical protein JWO90_2028 [Solirubrobacterales bacterium]|jgi:uncharacterized protein YbcI|nr:hypothetical protein [Solirubrobacterales bacterium]
MSDHHQEPTVLQQVSNEFGRIYKDQFGRGPTRVRSDFASPDVLVIVLENSLTPGERTLIQMGAEERLREHRMFVQYASVADFCEPVERLTGRIVRAFISGIDAREDVSVETFVLHPEGTDVVSRGLLP